MCDAQYIASVCAKRGWLDFKWLCIAPCKPRLISDAKGKNAESYAEISEKVCHHLRSDGIAGFAASRALRCRSDLPVGYPQGNPGAKESTCMIFALFLIARNGRSCNEHPAHVREARKRRGFVAVFCVQRHGFGGRKGAPRFMYLLVNEF